MIEKLAKNGNAKKYDFPLPFKESPELKFSFSGLKTSLRYKMQTMSAAGFVQTKYCEGLYLTSYQDSRGVWTIGYGRIEYDDGHHVGAGETCSHEDAERWLLEDVENDGSHYVRAWVKIPLTQNQFDALGDGFFSRPQCRPQYALVIHHPRRVTGHHNRRMAGC